MVDMDEIQLENLRRRLNRYRPPAGGLPKKPWPDTVRVIADGSHVIGTRREGHG